MNDTQDTSPSAVAAQIGVAAGSSSNWRKRARRFWPLALIVMAPLAWWIWHLAFGTTPLRYETEAVTRGDLVVKVSATGKLQPTTQVDVGSELSGIIETVSVEDNDRVSKGQELARLDTSKLEDQVANSEAAVLAAQATLQMNQAATLQARGDFERAQQAWQLSAGKLPSKSDLAAAEATLAKAVASEAAAKAAIAEAQATLRADRTNLRKAVIRSPIDGVVLLRDVEPGQTVAATLQAPVLFTLAQSLTQMELHADIDEADVGQVQAGQAASFTVDAYPDRRYPATIKRVRYGAETTNGVVTYQGVLQVANEDLSLRPGMTGSASIITQQRQQVLLVPNAALRYAPQTSAAASQQGSSVTSLLMPRMRQDAAKTATTVIAQGSEQTVWILDADQTPHAVKITVGASDGRQTEVVSGALKPGDLAVVDSEVAP
ncbi:efflux RND transporter periplasmic adaptor subunit [Solimonas flava]|uniref:efflux RND transporter periplasmic adaptor subunit n=1 Tax=Solimonas flava TaxID=415849 RepID=UPI0003F77470|nr:efflux RND transporter periplasmic adaptor subunit [Solimonas flava]